MDLLAFSSHFPYHPRLYSSLHCPLSSIDLFSTSSFRTHIHKAQTMSDPPKRWSWARPLSFSGFRPRSSSRRSVTVVDDDLQLRSIPQIPSDEKSDKDEDKDEGEEKEYVAVAKENELLDLIGTPAAPAGPHSAPLPLSPEEDTASPNSIYASRPDVIQRRSSYKFLESPLAKWRPTSLPSRVLSGGGDSSSPESVGSHRSGAGNDDDSSSGKVKKIKTDTLTANTPPFSNLNFHASLQEWNAMRHSAGSGSGHPEENKTKIKIPETGLGPAGGEAPAEASKSSDQSRTPSPADSSSSSGLEVWELVGSCAKVSPKGTYIPTREEERVDKLLDARLELLLDDFKGATGLEGNVEVKTHGTSSGNCGGDEELPGKEEEAGIVETSVVEKIHHEGQLEVDMTMGTENKNKNDVEELDIEHKSRGKNKHNMELSGNAEDVPEASIMEENSGDVRSESRDDKAAYKNGKDAKDGENPEVSSGQHGQNDDQQHIETLENGGDILETSIMEENSEEFRPDDKGAYKNEKGVEEPGIGSGHHGQNVDYTEILENREDISKTSTVGEIVGDVQPGDQVEAESGKAISPLFDILVTQNLQATIEGVGNNTSSMTTSSIAGEINTPSTATTTVSPIKTDVQNIGSINGTNQQQTLNFTPGNPCPEENVQQPNKVAQVDISAGTSIPASSPGLQARTPRHARKQPVMTPRPRIMKWETDGAAEDDDEPWSIRTAKNHPQRDPTGWVSMIAEDEAEIVAAYKKREEISKQFRRVFRGEGVN
ncbi:hypothetical protein BZA05DRAFT_110445 [Tricharina praecox]|uniref:uncharacterized protein n=1 Tax=Tricharina praecox TaxID=43433 RepID=UPI0022204DAF|nr:uncharacterized protein BZA05DRAFT_110445 [Tricharina praecox]KAI5857940.1 hypothetical protein BZA05DRAFT_110445 [Tricharina praecox]